MTRLQPLRVGVAGPVGSGKTALVDALCKRLRDQYDIAVVTNDIYTKEDAQFLMRIGASSASRPAAARTRPSARTRRSTSTLSTACRESSRRWTS